MHEIVSLPLVDLKADALIMKSFEAAACLYTEALQELHKLRGTSVKHYDHQYAHHALAQIRAAIAGLPYLEFSVAYLPSDVESPWVEEANRFSKEGITRHSGGGSSMLRFLTSLGCPLQQLAQETQPLPRPQLLPRPRVPTP